MVMFRVCLYFSKSVGRSVHLYFLYKRIIFFISHVSQGGGGGGERGQFVVFLLFCLEYAVLLVQ